MSPSFRPAARVVVGYPIHFNDAPTYNELETIEEVVTRHAGKKLTLHGGNCTYVDLIDWDGPTDTSQYFLGCSVASTYGSPDTDQFTLATVDRAFNRLQGYESIAQTTIQALQKVRPAQGKKEAVVAFLFDTGNGQADVTMYLGGEGSIQVSRGRWCVSTNEDPKLAQRLTATFNERFPASDEPMYELEAATEWMHNQKKPHDYNVHGSLRYDNVGFLYGKHVATLLEGCTERTFTRKAFSALGAHTQAKKGTGASFVVRSVHY